MQQISKCPHCGEQIPQFKTYPFSITKRSGTFLTALKNVSMNVNNEPDNYIHYSEIIKAQKEMFGHNLTSYSMLAANPFNLIMKNRYANGQWKLTQDGIDFLNGKLNIPKTVVFRTDKKVFFIGNERISIKDIIK